MGKCKKYKILEAKKNKNLVNEEVVVENLPLKQTGGSDAPKWFKDFVDKEFRPLVNKVDKIDRRIDNLAQVNNLKE